MEEVVIPHGKQLRYRCSVEGCLRNKSFSMFSIMDHVASHFSQQKGSDLVFNYYCKLCGIRFFLKGMCLGCKCNARDGGEQFISLKHEITFEDVEREASFFWFLNKWIVPVFDDIPGAPPAAATVTVETTVDTDEVEVIEEHGSAFEEQRSLSKKVRPCTPYPTSSAPVALGHTPHLPKNALRIPAEKSRIVAHEGDIQMENFEGGFLTASRTPLPYAEIDADEEGLQLPAHYPAAMRKLQNCSNTSAMDIVEDGTHGAQAPPSPPSAQTSFYSIDNHGPTNSGYARPLNSPPPPPPPPLYSKEPSSHSECEHSKPTCDKKKRCLPTTARLSSKKSRQDGLVEENPSPPRLSKRLSHSPGNNGSKISFNLESGPKTPPGEPHISSESCRPGHEFQAEQSGLPAPNNAYQIPVAPSASAEASLSGRRNAPANAMLHRASLVHTPPLSIPLPPPQTLAAVSPTPTDDKEYENDVVQVASQRSGIVNGRKRGKKKKKKKKNEDKVDQTLKFIIPPAPFLPPHLPPPFPPPPPYPYMGPGHYQPFPLPFPMSNHYGPGLPPQSGMSYTVPPDTATWSATTSVDNSVNVKHTNT